MGEWLTLRSFRAGDGEAIAALGPSLSTQTLHARFWIGSPVIPSSYLDLVRTRWPADWNAVMACRDGRVIGWADCGRNVDGSSDVAVCLVDAEQGRGTGVLLLQAALDLSSNLGIPVARAGIQRSNVHALHAWRRAVPPDCVVERSGDATSLDYVVDARRWSHYRARQACWAHASEAERGTAAVSVPHEGRRRMRRGVVGAHGRTVLGA